MTTFVDTNVLVHAFDGRDARKQARAIQILESGERLVVCAQVLGEFYVTVTRKLAEPLGETDAAAVIDRLAQLPVVATDGRLVLAAVDTARVHQVSYWDALVIEAAATAGCEVLLSEDLAHGSTLRGVRIENPFA